MATLGVRRGSECVTVVQVLGQYELVALRSIAAGEKLFSIEGEKTFRPSRYSVQIDDNMHIDAGDCVCAEHVLNRRFWRFMNHSCQPSVQVCGQDVIALRVIQPLESVTYNYNTTEWDMATPFSCYCRSVDCIGEIRGFKYLTPVQRNRIDSLVAPHLKRILAREPVLVAGSKTA